MKWKPPPTKPVPLHVMQMIPFDYQERVLVMHRSSKVRSARNCWSFPSGLHDIGESYRLCAHRELNEEYGLVSKQIYPMGLYENIAGDSDAEEQYHWVITVVGALVDDVRVAVNKEPKKHDGMRTDLTLTEMLNVEKFLLEHTFHKSFSTYFSAAGAALITRLKERLADDNR